MVIEYERTILRRIQCNEIPARVLQELDPSIAPWLSSIFQQSFDTGAVPSDWTKALVTAIHNIYS